MVTMGKVAGISHNEFPRQSSYVGKPVDVTFGYDTTRTLSGTLVRDDLEAPWETIILLYNGRCVRGVECQYSPWDALQNANAE